MIIHINFYGNANDGNDNGITLIALVIIIIVLLILAGISVKVMSGNDGILGKSITAGEEYQKAAATEVLEELILNARIESAKSDTSFDFMFLKEYLMGNRNVEMYDSEDDEIYGCLNEYNYDFLINDQNQIVYVSRSNLGKYMLTYDYNGGAGENRRRKVEEGTINLTKKYPTRAGYKFIGWSTDKNAETPMYSIGENMVFEMPAKDVTLYAIWSRKTITYNANGGINAPGVQDVSEGETQITSDFPLKDDMDFVGWSTDSEAENSEYNLGEKYNIDEDLVLYAVWKPSLYRTIYISTDGNDTTGTGKATKPFATFVKAIDSAESGNKICFGEGRFELSPIYLDQYGCVGITDKGKQVEIYGKNEKTVLYFNGEKKNARDGNAFCCSNSNTVVRNFVYEFTPYHNSASYGNAFFRWSNANFENIFFRVLTTRKPSYLYYNDQTTANRTKIKNCTFFINCGSVNGNYSGIALWTNIATNVGVQGGSIVNQQVNAFGTSADNTLALVEKSKAVSSFNEKGVGVFYGDYAW